MEGAPVGNFKTTDSVPTNERSPYSLVDEGEKHFMVQNNETGQQRAIAKAELPDAWHENIRKFPKWETGETKLVQTESPAMSTTPVAGTPEAPVTNVEPVTVEPVVAAPVVVAPVKPSPFAADLSRFQADSMKAIQGAAAAQSTGLEQTAAVQADYEKSLAAESAHYLKTREDWEAKTAKMQEDVLATKIDPGRWWSQQTGAAGVGKRILAIIGMGLGGAIQARTGVNPMAQTLSELINKDIDAQKEDLGTKKTILNQYMQQYGNIDSAHRAAFIDMATMAQAQLAKIAATSQSEVVKQNANLAIANLTLQVGEKKHELATQQATLAAQAQLAGGNPDDAALMLLPKEIQERAVRLPDTVGKDGKPVRGKLMLANTSDDAKQVKEVQVAVQSLRTIMQKMAELQKKSGAEITNAYPEWMPGKGVFSSDAEDEAKALQQAAFTTFRALNAKSGRPGEYTDGALAKLFPNVTEADQGGVKKSLGQGSALIESMLNNEYASRLTSGGTSRAAETAQRVYKPGL
jgi:hypothetical protein